MLPRSVRRLLFWSYYVFFLALSVFVILAPRSLLERWYASIWSWLLLIPPVWWLVGFIRSLRRGEE